MPVQDFALDAQGDQRVQIHWSTSIKSGSVSVLLNRSLIGSLDTLEERAAGKDFTLPDHSLLHVQFPDNQPQVFRNGTPLSSIAQAATESASARKRGGCLTAWIILNLVVICLLTLIYFLALLGSGSTNVPVSPLAFLAYGLLGCVGIAGFVLLLAWKKWGFYLIALYVVANIPLAFLFHVVDYRAFTPLIGLAVLYFLLQRSNAWEHLA